MGNPRAGSTQLHTTALSICFLSVLSSSQFPQLLSSLRLCPVLIFHKYWHTSGSYPSTRPRDWSQGSHDWSCDAESLDSATQNPAVKVKDFGIEPTLPPVPPVHYGRPSQYLRWLQHKMSASEKKCYEKHVKEHNWTSGVHCKCMENLSKKLCEKPFKCTSLRWGY